MEYTPTVHTTLALSQRPWVILLAAGMGCRLAEATQGVPKQFLVYKNAPLYWHSALCIAHCPPMAGIIFVFPPDSMEREQDHITRLNKTTPLGLPWRVVAGGKQRQDSVRHGLAALPPHCAHVLIHDAARPFASAALFYGIWHALSQNNIQGVIPAIAVQDTIKVVEYQQVLSTLPRASLVAVQTPQGFVVETLRMAHAKALEHGWQVTDDAALLEQCGIPVHVVPGEAGNHKITTVKDIAMLHTPAELPVPRTGFGYDVHRFGGNRSLRLGGVPMPGGLCVHAHSDGDVLLHALMDALLGCACAGDIGQHFPDTLTAHDNADSALLLHKVLDIVQENNLRVLHADMTVITQKPKIAPHRQEIQRNVARLLGLGPHQVNVKATTEEGMGFTGSGEGIKAVALVTAISTLTNSHIL